jgi:tRNA (cmo5U34)-methyltransferase
VNKSSEFKVPERWTFRSKAVAAHFDRHVRESLPWYDLATNAVAQLGRHFIPRGGTVYDVGASLGNIGLALQDTLADRKAKFFAIEESQEMADKYRGPEKLVVADALRHQYEPYDFAVCFLVLMFFPPEHRQAFLSLMTDRLKVGGALVIVDKVEPQPGYLATVFNRLTLQQKLSCGATPEEILRKELALAGYQRPLDPRLLPKAARTFFQMGEFVGWVVCQGDAPRAASALDGQRPGW